MQIKIEDILSKPNNYKDIDFAEIIPDINSKKEVKATVHIEVVGKFIKVFGNVKATLILECVRCLKKEEKDFSTDFNEIISLETEPEFNKNEVEIKDNAFYIELENQDIFDVTDFLYQTLILITPNQYVCGINCKGEDNILEKYTNQDNIDPRLEVFKKIKIEKE